MQRYLDAARRYRWVIVVVLALTIIPAAYVAYVEYTTTFEADATVWTQRASQQFNASSPRDPGLATLATPAAEQAGVLAQLLQTRSFLREVALRTSLRIPDSAADERRFFEEVSRRFRVEVLGTNLVRLSYRARDPGTGAKMVMAALALRQERLAETYAAATAAATTFYRNELALAQARALDAQTELDRFDERHRPPLSGSDDYVQRQLRSIVEETKAHVTDLKTSIARSTVLLGTLQVADNLDFQIVDTPLEEARPSGGTRAAAMVGGSGVVGGIALVSLLILAGTLLANRVGGEADIARLAPATLFATMPDVARGKGWAGRELRTALADIAFTPPSNAERARQQRE